MGKYAPRGLSAEAKKLYRETVRETGMDVIDDAASMTLLENGCRALDRLRRAEKVVREKALPSRTVSSNCDRAPHGGQDRRRGPSRSPIAGGDHEP